jgi:predicted acyltransferase
MKRLEAIDQFRGFAILLMVLANYLNNVASIPPWLKHADDIGYTVIDLIAPMFVFAMGLTYGLSFRRRLEERGAWITCQHFLIRYLALIGLGFLITLTWEMSGIRPPSINWGLFQALGAAGLITLLVIRLPLLWRFVVGLAMLFGYQVLLDRYWLQEVLGAPHNGPWGALSWGAFLILATAMADLYHTERTSRRVYPLVSAVWVVVGLALIQWIPVSKDRVSVSYVLISLGLSSLMFFLFHLGVNEKQWRIPVLTDWGRNPLLLYIMSYILLGICVLPPAPAWYVLAPIWLVVIQLFVMVAVLSWAGHFLNQRRLYFVL